MSRLLATVCLSLTCVWALVLGPASAAALSGRLLVANSRGVELFDPSTDKLRRVTTSGTGPAFFPSGKGFAYVRAGAFNAPGRYTKYSVFLKSFAERDPAVRGRQIFGWNQFFVRAVDISPKGRLVFSAEPGPGPDQHGRGMEIYSAALDGSGLRRLTHNHVFDNDPVVSPDGRHIAFARRVAGRGQIFSMRTDGTHEMRLTRNGRRDRLPAWAPDGRRIAFISELAKRDRREVYVVGSHGRRERRLTHNHLTENRVAYSPNGRSIAFLHAGRLWAMDADGDTPRQILTAKEPEFEGGLDWGR
jgi:Tol biopolymer transport system component